MFKMCRWLIILGMHGKAHRDAEKLLYRRLHDMGLGE